MITKRYEIKFVVKDPVVGISKQLIKQQILRNPFSFRSSFPDRVVNNIYYDTSDLISLHQNLNGSNTRTKYRIRWYDDQIKKANLEVKYKKNQLGWKQYYKINDSFDFLNTRDLKLIGSPNINNLCLQKSMQNAYTRSYFTSLDHKFRFTVDSNIKNINVHNPLNIMYVNKIVVELKFDKSGLLDSQTLLNYFPLRQVKNSKFVSGSKFQNN